LLRILGMLHLGYALQTLGNLMKATLAAVQLQVRLLARLVKNILANNPARIIGNVAAALFGVLALFQTEEKLGFVARSTGFVEIVCGTGQSAGRATRWILSEMATSSTHPVLVPLELYKSSNISVFYGNICCTIEPRLPFNVVFTQDQKSN